MQVLGAMQKEASLNPLRKTQSGENPTQIRPSSYRNMSESQYSYILEKHMNRGKYGETW